MTLRKQTSLEKRVRNFPRRVVTSLTTNEPILYSFLVKTPHKYRDILEQFAQVEPNKQATDGLPILVRGLVSNAEKLLVEASMRDLSLLAQDAVRFSEQITKLFVKNINMKGQKRGK